MDNSTGWPWYAAKIPPSDFYDCLFLYYSCTDFETPGEKKPVGLTPLTRSHSKSTPDWASNLFGGNIRNYGGKLCLEGWGVGGGIPATPDTDRKLSKLPAQLVN